MPSNHNEYYFQTSAMQERLNHLLLFQLHTYFTGRTSNGLFVMLYQRHIKKINDCFIRIRIRTCYIDATRSMYFVFGLFSFFLAKIRRYIWARWIVFLRFRSNFTGNLSIFIEKVEKTLNIETFYNSEKLLASTCYWY